MGGLEKAMTKPRRAGLFAFVDPSQAADLIESSAGLVAAPTR